MKTLTLYHGTRNDELIAEFDPAFSQDRAVSVWLTSSRSYAADYGLVSKHRVVLSNPLDLRSITTPAAFRQRERLVEEWVALFQACGLNVQLLDEEWVGVPVKLWDLLDDADLDATRATNLADALRASAHDAIICWEVGAAGQSAVAYGVLKMEVFNA